MWAKRHAASSDRCRLTEYSLFAVMQWFVFISLGSSCSGCGVEGKRAKKMVVASEFFMEDGVLEAKAISFFYVNYCDTPRLARH
jgi:hypothetical protein